MAEPERLPQDVFEILFASDIHLGYAHKDATRGKDSLQTFEEILSIARERRVDFVLLGGDLFHQSNPPKQIMDGCIRLLRSYCLGDKPIDFDLIGDSSSENHGSFNLPQANFKDKNLNIALPIFSIHGVHDDPTGLYSCRLR
jgi:double-strand break repair protein MRE11